MRRRRLGAPHNGDGAASGGNPHWVDKGAIMAKFLVRATMTHEGVQGLLKEGGSKRREAVADMVKGVGGSLEAFYFAFGADDVFTILEFPDDVTAAAASLTVSATGVVHTEVVKLLTPEEIDEATKKTVSYRAPGR
jgi:uncharacterized protein with GYD domain